MTNDETQGVKLSYHVVLEKFDGEGTEPENLVERRTIVDGVPKKVETFKKGKLTATREGPEIEEGEGRE